MTVTAALRPSGSSEVLVVDDDNDMVRLIKKIVERLGHQCTTADSGEAAVACLAEAKFDLLVTDINMSGLSGLDLLEAAGRADPDLAVMVVSGIADPATAESALAGGAFAYVVKPFDLMELQIAVSGALRRRELETELRRHLHHLEFEVDRRTEQLRAATDNALKQERRFRSLAHASPLGIIYADSDGELDYHNSKAELLLGRHGAQLSGRRWLSELESTGGDRLEDAIRATASGIPDVICEYELRRPDGSLVWIQNRVAPVLDEEHVRSGFVVVFEDITDRKRLEYQLRYQAAHDHLTGLPNRRAFREQVSNRLLSLEDGDLLGVMLVDLDQFKLVNDTYGHEAGDQLIVAIGERLTACVSPSALVARLGGDEYVVALSVKSREEIVAVAQAIRNALRKPIRIMGVELSLSVSVGVGTTSDAQSSANGVLRSADIAMHHAKIRRDVVEMFDTSMAKDVARRLALTSELRRAVNDQLLTVQYQPVVHTTTERLVGLEALARWTHHEWGRIAPDEFIPIAESMGLVHEIDRQVMMAAVTQLAEWRNAGRIDPAVFVSVNVSASQLSNSALPMIVSDALQRSGLDGSSLCIEVTESSLISDIDRAVPVMQELRALGVRIAIDDFGTGHSALSYLGQLPVDILKIDGSFIAAIGSGAVDLAELIVDLAHRFELEVIAEGVEEPHQLHRLRSIGCDMVQGFLTGRPAEADRAVPTADPQSENAVATTRDAVPALPFRSEVST